MLDGSSMRALAASNWRVAATEPERKASNPGAVPAPIKVGVSQPAAMMAWPGAAIHRGFLPDGERSSATAAGPCGRRSRCRQHAKVGPIVLRFGDFVKKRLCGKMARRERGVIVDSRERFSAAGRCYHRSVGNEL